MINKYIYCHQYILLIFVCSFSIFSFKAVAQETSEFTLPSRARIRISEEKFSTKEFNVLGCNEKSDVCLINNRLPFGIINQNPRTYIKNIYVYALGKKYKLDSSAMFDAWNGRALIVKGVRYFGGGCFDAENCQFRGVFSDGAATFVAEWKISGGKSCRTILTDSDDVVGLFLKKIDPPVFE